MRHYMDRSGARYLLRASEDPRKGDFVIIPDMPRFWVPSPQVQQRLALYATREYNSAIPLRLFSRRAHAGFYAHHWGLMPFSVAAVPHESFQIWEVRH